MKKFKFTKENLIPIIFCVLVVIGFINFRNRSNTLEANSEATAKIKTSPSPFPQSPLSTSSLITDISFVKKQFPLKCPEDYEDKAKYIEDLAKFVSIYQKMNPDSTIADLGKYRVALLEENNCKETLKNLGQTKEYVAGYYAAYEDPHVLHLRKVLNGYLDGTNVGMDTPGLTIEKKLSMVSLLV